MKKIKQNINDLMHYFELYLAICNLGICLIILLLTFIIAIIETIITGHGGITKSGFIFLTVIFGMTIYVPISTIIFLLIFCINYAFFKKKCQKQPAYKAIKIIWITILLLIALTFILMIFLS